MSEIKTVLRPSTLEIKRQVQAWGWERRLPEAGEKNDGTVQAGKKRSPMGHPRKGAQLFREEFAVVPLDRSRNAQPTGNLRSGVSIQGNRQLNYRPNKSRSGDGQRCLREYDSNDNT